MISLELEHTQAMLDNMMLVSLRWNSVLLPRSNVFTSSAVYWALRGASERTRTVERMRRLAAEIALEYGLDDSVCWWGVAPS